MALAFGDEKMEKQFETVPLSDQTVARKVMKLSEHVSAKTKDIVQQCQYYSLALDESTDVCEVSQLLIFIRTIDEELQLMKSYFRQFHFMVQQMVQTFITVLCLWSMRMVALKSVSVS